MKFFLVCIGALVAVIILMPIILITVLCIIFHLAFVKEKTVNEPMPEEYGIPKNLNFFIYQKSI